MKGLKIVLWTLAAIVAVVLLAVLTIPLWIGPVVTGTANKVVPDVTGTGFHMGEFGLNPYSGKVHIGDVQLQNPSHYFEKTAEAPKEEGVLSGALSAVKKAGEAVTDLVSTPETNAVSFTSIDVRLATTSLLTDTIHIEEIVVKDFYLYAEAPLVSNLREIVAYATKDAKEEKEEKEPSETKVIIDRISIEGLTVKFGSLPITLTDPIVITDIGKDEPATEEGAIDAVVNAICSAVEATSSVAGAALKTTYAACKAMVTGVGDLAEGGAEALKSGAEAVKGLIPGLGK